MEKFIFGENKQESLQAEAIRRTQDFIRDARIVILKDFITIDLINKLLNTIASYKDMLMTMASKNNEDDIEIKIVLEELNDLETVCVKHKRLH